MESIDQFMFREVKYLSGYTIPATAILAIWKPEYFAFLTLIYAFVIIPLLEQWLSVDTGNLSEVEEKGALKDRVYDWVLYLSVPIQWSIIGLFLFRVSNDTFTTVQLIGMITATGICSGVLGINVAHELGHRVEQYERVMAWLLLLSSMYMHFYVEHNRGHHRYVATPEDPATAQKNESLYGFWLRSIVGSYLSAWRIQVDLLRKGGHSFLSIHNQMLIFQLTQGGMLALIGLFFGFKTLLLFLPTALMGILLLETINYIEHYGLSRKEKVPGVYEKVLPCHSWNSNFTLGRIMLFELTRHADHHYKASRKYQVLRHFDDSPQLPAGYPAMMLLSTIPPLWFKVMNPRIDVDGRGSSSLIPA